MRSQMVPVSEAARRLGVNRFRVHQRIAAGSLKAEKVGSSWLVDAAGLRPARASRPMSPSMVWALARAGEGKAPDVRPAERSRLNEKLWRLREEPADELPRLVSSWLADRARRVELEVHPEDLPELRADPGLRLSGVSDPRAGLASGSDLEAYVAAGDLDELADRYFLDLDAQPERPNVILHVLDQALHGDVPRLFSAADLFERGGAREERAGLELLGRA